MRLSAAAKKYLKMIKPLDLMIVVLLILLSFAPLRVFSLQEQKEQSAGAQEILTAVITHKGKVVHKIKLTGHTGTTKYRFTNGKAYNVVVATGKKLKSSKLTVRIRFAFSMRQLAKQDNRSFACHIN